MTICRRCNSESNENDSICPKCGSPLYDMDYKNFEVKIDDQEYPVADTKNFFRLFILLAILFVFMVVCIIIALL
jgi:uncharacterized membrane protein YvbJ